MTTWNTAHPTQQPTFVRPLEGPPYPCPIAPPAPTAPDTTWSFASPLRWAMNKLGALFAAYGKAVDVDAMVPAHGEASREWWIERRSCGRG
jgi:hypothetical protein